ncbi:glutamate--tRNA ligase [Myceligenerans xiligouense]|uniref:Glutamate--tRNA ligase n=1 Tax=Myceligenerans xiligouense TaxID=253184 RepID=A0A3N4YLP5_9MICO|nr:glutamate--tRNA ligase [Myceligenerans xiligouense]RPF20356.1 glutamyl-tRNA synthetase [Myceligenerans xiligouense]
MTNPEIRVRFAPSPTGMFHVGNARSALFNWVFARQSGGSLVLRIEDTDAERSKPEWVQGILEAMAWLGIDESQYEGPLFQSDYAGKHQEAIDKLLADGRAYYCDCTREDVIARTGSSHKGYDGFCRDRGLEPGDRRAVRFRTPDEGTTIVVDLVRGKPEFENGLLEDFVIARGDGSPVFLLANVVDDMEMGITHVMRAEEHLPNAPKQQLIWEALGAQAPTWAHAPILVNEKRQKLSKRRDRVALEDFRAEGYVAEAMRNYLMLLGWAPSDDREIVPWDEIVSEFRLEDVNPSPAFFDIKKLQAFNGDYIRAMAVDAFTDAVQPWLTSDDVPWPAEAYDPAVFDAVAELVQTRIVLLGDVVEMVDFLFLERPAIDEAAWDKAMRGEHAADILAATIERYEAIDWNADTLKTTLEEIGAVHGLKLGKTQAPVRVAITGRRVGLPLFESMEVLGRERTLERLKSAMAQLG